MRKLSLYVRQLKNLHQICSLLIQVIIYILILLYKLIQQIELQNLIISVIFVVISISLLGLIFKFSISEEAQHLKIRILTKLLTSVIVMLLPTLNKRSISSQIVQSLFVGQLIAQSQIKQYKTQLVKKSNKYELIFTLFLNIFAALVIYFQSGSEDNEIILLLFCADLLLKLIIYIYSQQKKTVQIENEMKKNDSTRPFQLSIFKSKQMIEYPDLTMKKIMIQDNLSLGDGSHRAIEIDISNSNNEKMFIKESSIMQDSLTDNFFFNEMMNFIEDGKSQFQFFQQGVAVLNKNKEIIISSSSFQNFAQSQFNNGDNGNLVMNLINCTEEIKQKQRSEIFFNEALKKASNLDLADCNMDQGSFFLNNIKLSKQNCEFKTVGQAFSKLINQFEEIGNDDNDIRKLDVDLLCSVGKAQKDNSQNKDEDILLNVSLRPFIYKDQLHVFIVIRDVTHQNEIKKLQLMNENKSNMIQSVAHEFRTPLNCIILLMEELGENSTKQIYKDYIEPVLISAQSLLSLIQDLLDLAQLRAGKFQLFYQDFNLLDLIEDLRLLLTPSLALKGNKLIIDTDPNFPRFINSDENRIRQILINLIGNAAKFTFNGKITIGVKWFIGNRQVEIYVKDTGAGINQEDQNKLFKAFSKIENTKEMNTQGVGLGLMISNVLAEKLCQYQELSVHQSLSNHDNFQGLRVYSEGKGLGSTFSFIVQDCTHLTRRRLSSVTQKSQHSHYLLLAQNFKLAEIMNESRGEVIRRNTLSNRSQNLIQNQLQEDGSEKNLNIQATSQTILIKSQIRIQYEDPILIKPKSQLSSCPEVVESENKIKEIKCQCPHILVVDDEPFNLIALRTLFRKYQIILDETTNPHEAIEKVRSYNCSHKNIQNYQLILMDLEMPTMNGFETAKEILQIKPESKIVACSGFSGEEMHQKCIMNGMKSLLTKPIKMQKLEEILRSQKLDGIKSPFQ